MNIFRAAKNKIGHSLPSPIRQRIAAAAMYGRSHYEKSVGNDSTASKARDEAIKLAKGKGRIPPARGNNRIAEMASFAQFVKEIQ